MNTQENTLGFSYVGSVRSMEFPFVGGWEHGIFKKMGVKNIKIGSHLLDTVLGTMGMEDIRQRK